MYVEKEIMSVNLSNKPEALPMLKKIFSEYDYWLDKHALDIDKLKISVYGNDENPNSYPSIIITIHSCDQESKQSFWPDLILKKSELIAMNQLLTLLETYHLDIVKNIEDFNMEDILNVTYLKELIAMDPFTREQHEEIFCFFRNAIYADTNEFSDICKKNTFLNIDSFDNHTQIPVRYQNDDIEFAPANTNNYLFLKEQGLISPEIALFVSSCKNDFSVDLDLKEIAVNVTDIAYYAEKSEPEQKYISWLKSLVLKDVTALENKPDFNVFEEIQKRSNPNWFFKQIFKKKNVENDLSLDF